METISSSSSIGVAAEAVLLSGCRTVFVVDDSGVLIGSVTEGDLVRAFLRGLNLGADVRHVMNTNPMFVAEESSGIEAKRMMTTHGHSAIPVVDESRKLISVIKQTDM